MSGDAADPMAADMIAADLMAAVWRASRDEAQVLLARIARLEQAVARAMAAPPPRHTAQAWAEILEAQRASLAATRARNALLASLLASQLEGTSG